MFAGAQNGGHFLFRLKRFRLEIPAPSRNLERTQPRNGQSREIPSTDSGISNVLIGLQADEYAFTGDTFLLVFPSQRETICDDGVHDTRFDPKDSQASADLPHQHLVRSVA